MRINPCFYCSAPVYPGHGSLFVRNDAKTFLFCGSKCKSHYRSRHNARRSLWTKTHRIHAGKELVNDSVLNFQAVRNVPVRYNRDLYIKTIQAIKRLQAIKQKRRERFFLERMRQSEEKLKRSAKSVSNKLDKLSKIESIIQDKEKKKIKARITKKEAEIAE